MLVPGTTLQNRYRIASELGQGGMGAVYRAWDMRLSIPVALKEMIPQPGLDIKALGQLRQQFHQEATVLARLSHPHLVRVSDFFEEGGNAYLVMNFVEGESLADRITRQGPLPETEVLAWGRQLLDALAYCHSQGIIHRDIKPQNVIINSDGQVVLVDFGLVKLWDSSDPRTKTVMRGMGTPEYAPPEQYEGEAGYTNPSSDIYGLGATLYHALVGQAPPTATLRMAAPERFVPLRRLNPNVSPTTEAAILRALELARSQRWQSAGEMMAALVSPIAPTPGQPPEHVTPAVPWRESTEVLPGVQPAAVATRRRVPVWLWVVAGVMVLTFVLCIGAVWAFRELARRGETVLTATAQAQIQAATATAQMQARATATAQAHAAATAQAVENTAVAQAQATSEALIIQSTATAQAQAKSSPRDAPATATVIACVHQTGLAPSDWRVAVCDSFDANALDWSEGDYAGDLITGEKSIASGRYRWEGNAIDDVIWWSIPDMEAVSDFYLTAKVRRVSGVEDGQYGLIFMRADNDNYGLFKIEDSQYFKFSIRHEGEWDTVIDWTESSTVRPGEFNRLTIVAVESHFTFYINDQYVGEADEARLNPGEAGVAIELLEAGDTAVFEFDDFEVHVP